MNRRLVAAGVTLLVAGAILLACGGDDESSSSSSGNTDGGATRETGGSDSGFSSDGASEVGTASGVVLLHAAVFPPFRLCFENYPQLLPQPDSTLMPESNLVGVEVGSLVRIAPLRLAPGKVWVFDQSELASKLPQGGQTKTCGDLLADDRFVQDLNYELAGEVTDPLGVDRVDVLAITGCANKVLLTSIGLTEDGCTGWDQTHGSLRAPVISLRSIPKTYPTSLPVQLVQMSPLLDSLHADVGTLQVSFGPLAADAGEPPQPLTVPPLFQAAAAVDLEFGQPTDSFFGSHGFTIALSPGSSVDGGGGDGGSGDGGAAAVASFSMTETLADVQYLSAPQMLPTAYYLTASNYALLLVGDPRVQRFYPDGGSNPSFNVRRAVHLLAIPVKGDADGGAQR